MYFGTINLDLGIKFSINPESDTGRRFEYGNGFYLTENKRNSNKLKVLEL